MSTSEGGRWTTPGAGPGNRAGRRHDEPGRAVHQRAQTGPALATRAGLGPVASRPADAGADPLAFRVGAGLVVVIAGADFGYRVRAGGDPLRPFVGWHGWPASLLGASIAALLGVLLLRAVAEHNRKASGIAAVFVPLVLLGYLSRLALGDGSTAGATDVTAVSMWVLLVGLLALFLAIRLRWLLAEEPATVRGTLLVVSSAAAAAGLLLLFAPHRTRDGDRFNPVLLGMRPTEILSACLLVGVVAFISAVTVHFAGPDRAQPPVRLAVMATVWATAAPVGLFVLTGNLGAALALAAGVLIVVALHFHMKVCTLAGAAAVGLSLAFFSLTPGLNRIVPGAAGDARVLENARTALAGTPWWGRGVDPRILTENAQRNEYALTLLGQQWGLAGVTTVLVLAATFVYLLFVLVSGQWRAGEGSATTVVAAGLAAMLAAGLVLPVAAFGLDLPAFRVVMPVLAADATSFVLTLAVFGFVVGDPEHRPTSTTSGGSGQ